MKIYLDTNTLRDCLKRRNLNTIRLLEIIRERKIECNSSIFSVMELIDEEKDDTFFNNHLRKGEEITSIMRTKNQRDLKIDDFNELSEIIKNFLATYNFIKFVTLAGEGWTTAFDVCKLSNLDADDSIHLASAIGTSDILLTSDSFFKKEGTQLIESHNNSVKENKINLEIKNPNEVLKLLEENQEDKKPKK